jgi:signal transduction histidine kinase
MQFAAIFPMTALGWIVVRRFSQALSISENYNKELTTKIQEAHSELKSGFDKLRQYENEKAINSERERVMRDMHDGVGAHIVSTLAMIEVGKFDQQEISSSLKDALNELRNIIDSLDPLANNVLSILASVRERFETRLNKANIKLIWRLSEKDIYPDLSPESALHFMRFLQEALTNVVKHAAATTICISTTDINGHLSITIQDNGSMITNDKTTGRGLQNMKQRATFLNASFSIENVGDGTVVKLDFKL